MIAVIKIELKVTGMGIAMTQRPMRLADGVNPVHVLPAPVAERAVALAKRGQWAIVDVPDDGKYVVIVE
jgi:hypothetical protein